MRAVVIPCRDEAASVSWAVIGAHKHADLVVVVDDGSRDNTQNLAAMYKAFVVAVVPGRAGLGEVYLEGVREALRQGADSVAVMSAGYRYNPQHVLRLWYALEDGADAVFGRRHGEDPVVHWEAEYRGSPWRRLLSLAATWLVNQVWGARWRDATSGMMGLGRRAAERLVRAGAASRGGFYPVEARVRLAAAGMRVEEVPVVYSAAKRRRRAGDFAEGLRLLLTARRWSRA